jgi:type I restriction enzyme S subunit
MKPYWKQVRIGEIGQIITGHTPSRKEPRYFGGKYPWIKPTDIEKNIRFVQKTDENFSDLAYEKYKKALLPKLATCVVTIGTVGEKICLTKESSFTNQAVNAIIPNNTQYDSMFVFYLLKYNLPLVAKRDSGTASGRHNISKVNFSNIPITVPVLLEAQKRISRTLALFDDLIEINLERIRILEEVAKAIFNEWFVDFRFPGHNHLEMASSKLGRVPSSWDLVRLADVLDALESGSRPKGGIDSTVRDIPSIGAENIIGLGTYDYSKEKYVTKQFFQRMKHGHVCNGDVLLYKDGAGIGQKAMFRNGFPHQECCINEHVFILRTNERCNQSYLYFWLDLPTMTQRIKDLNANAAQPGINQSQVKGLPILVPDSSLLRAFEDLTEPLLTELFNLANKNRVLYEIRDLLLPRLMSGETNVDETENGSFR